MNITSLQNEKVKYWLKLKDKKFRDTEGVYLVEGIHLVTEALKNNMPIDIIAIGLKDVLTNLGEITGEEASEEIINEIFARFCLGK